MRRDLIGETFLNQFRVETFVAAGGMATIYRVWDLQRMVPLAMKVLHPELAEDPSFMQRFQREARSLQMLIHPNIVPFYGLYRGDGLTFLLERYIDGPSLEDLLRRRAGRPLRLSEALVFFKALYTSLGYAHAQGIIHCDIKPGNVLIDQGGHVYLTDFGIARFLDAAITTSSALGTPLYMAPEQIRGERLTPRTDIYSLGVLMFELFSGQRPFRGDTNIPPGVGDNPSDRIRYEQLYQPAPDPRMYNPSLPEGLAEVVQRAMAKDPDQRYPTVQAMAEAIAQVIAARIETLPDRVRLDEDMNPPPGPDPDPARRNAPGQDAPAPIGWPPPEAEPGVNVPEDDAPQGEPQEVGYQDGGQRDGLPEGMVIPPYDGSWDTHAAGQGTRPAWQAQSPAGVGPDETLPGAPAPARELPPQARQPARTPARRGGLRWLWLLIGALVLVSLCGLAGSRLVSGLAARAGLPGAVSKTPQVVLPPGLPPATATAAASATLKAAATVTAEAAEGTLQPTAQPIGDFPVTGEIAVPVHENGIESLYLVNAATGQMTRLPTVPNVKQVGVSAPEWSPDGSRITFIGEYKNRLHVVVMNMTEMEPYQLPAGEAYAHVSSPAWTPDGKSVTFWASGGGQNYLITADATTGQQTNAVTLPVYRNLFVWNWQSGQLAYVEQEGSIYKTFVGDSPNGSAQAINLNGEVYAPAWSRDGQWLAFQSDTGKSSGNEIWISKPDSGQAHAVTQSPGESWSRAPTWSPDGKQIAFVSDRSGSSSADFGELFVVDLASGKVRQLTNTGGRVYDWRPAWRP